MRYMVLTSGGAILETDSAAQYVSWLDQHGPEVVDQHEPTDAEQQRLTNRALLEAQPCGPHQIRNCVRCYGL